MHVINITVRNKIAVNPAQDRYVCGNSDYVVHFDFDEEWDALGVKTARFIKEDGTYQEQVFAGNECPVPVISDTYKIMVGVFAGNLSTTTAAYIPAKKSILCGGGSPAAPDDDKYHQAMEEMAKVADAAFSNANNAANSAEAAVKAAEQAVKSEETAGQYSANADSQAETAGKHAQAAKQSETAAETSAENAEKAAKNATKQADDAENAEKNARELAEKAEAAASNASTSAANAAKAEKNAETHAKNAENYYDTTRQHASVAASKAAESAAFAKQAEDSVKDFYIVKLSGGKTDKTLDEVVAAVAAGKVCMMVDTSGMVLHCVSASESRAVFVNHSPTEVGYTVGINECTVIMTGGNATNVLRGEPSRTPNPYPLILTDDNDNWVEYDGSKQVEIKLPAGGGTGSGGGAGLPETAAPLKQLVTDPDGKVTWGDPIAYKYAGKVESEIPVAAVDGNEDGVSDEFYLTTPWAVDPVAGAKWDIVYNGAPHTCELVDMSVLMPDFPAGMAFVAGNLAAVGEVPEGTANNPDAPFCLQIISNDLGASEGGYGMIVPMDGASSVTLAIAQDGILLKTLDPELMGQKRFDITITKEEHADATFSSEIDFLTAWAMDERDLAASIRIVEIEYGKTQGQHSVKTVTKVSNPAGTRRQIEIEYSGNIHVNSADFYTDTLVWAANMYGDIVISEEWEYKSSQRLPTSTATTAYLKWYQADWRAVSLAELKADLGVQEMTVDAEYGVSLDVASVSETVNYADVLAAVRAGANVRMHLHNSGAPDKNDRWLLPCVCVTANAEIIFYGGYDTTHVKAVYTSSGLKLTKTNG